MNGPTTPAREAPPTGHGFGTFKGVFTPSILTILGVIMYLRLGWVLGQAGLVPTLIIVTLASLVTFVTGLSIAAIATNMKVGIGGAYYIISRSLGVQAGAAVGLPLFLAQALGVSFYVVGFAEALCATFPVLPMTVVGVATLVVLAGLAFFSADLALKTQFFILAAILISLVSFALGGPPEGGFEIPAGPLPPSLPFWVVFAVFFPAVTGIEAGVAMSGDLEDPGRSLPRGTVTAVLVGYAIYIAIPLVLAAWVPREVLLADSLIMQRVALYGPAILVGVWGATLSSALGALLGAPRTLQALARDRVLPAVLGRGAGPSNEPRVATALTFAIALVGILLGTLNVIAPVLSMFFLTSYGFLNLSAGLEGLLGSPSWRPVVKTPWWLSLGGATLCLVIMFMINAGAAFVAATVCGGIYFAVHRRQMRAYWGDMRRGLLVYLARFAIYRLAAGPGPDEHSWSPNILVLSGSPSSRWYLIELANAMVHHSGFLTVATVVPDSSAPAHHPDDAERAITSYLRRREVTAVVKVHVADDPMEGAFALMQASGVGPLVPNTFLLGETEDPENVEAFTRLLRLAWQRHRNVVVVREADQPPPQGPRRRLDLWWSGGQKNVGLMLTLAYLLQRSADWGDVELNVLTVVDSEEEAPHAIDRIRGLAGSGRLDITPGVVVHQGDPFEAIRARSVGANMVFLGMRAPGPEESDADYARYYLDLLAKTDGMPATALTLANEDVEFQRIFA